MLDRGLFFPRSIRERNCQSSHVCGCQSPNYLAIKSVRMPRYISLLAHLPLAKKNPIPLWELGPKIVNPISWLEAFWVVKGSNLSPYKWSLPCLCAIMANYDVRATLVTDIHKFKCQFMSRFPHFRVHFMNIWCQILPFHPGLLSSLSLLPRKRGPIISLLVSSNISGCRAPRKSIFLWPFMSFFEWQKTWASFRRLTRNFR